MWESQQTLKFGVPVCENATGNQLAKTRERVGLDVCGKTATGRISSKSFAVVFESGNSYGTTLG